MPPTGEAEIRDMVTSNIDTLVAGGHTLMAQSDKYEKISIKNVTGITLSTP